MRSVNLRSLTLSFWAVFIRSVMCSPLTISATRMSPDWMSESAMLIAVNIPAHPFEMSSARALRNGNWAASTMEMAGSET